MANLQIRKIFRETEIGSKKVVNSKTRQLKAVRVTGICHSTHSEFCKIITSGIFNTPSNSYTKCQLKAVKQGLIKVVVYITSLVCIKHNKSNANILSTNTSFARKVLAKHPPSICTEFPQLHFRQLVTLSNMAWL